MNSRASSLSIYNECPLQAVPKRVLGAERRAQHTCRKSPGPDSSTGGGSGQGPGRLQMVRVLGWQTVGGRFFFFLCTPNKLRTFFFLLKSPGGKWGQEEWQAEAAPIGKVSYPGIPWRASRWDAFRSLWNYTHRFLSLGMFSGTKSFSLLSAPQRSSCPKHVKNPWWKYQIHLQTLQNEPIFHPIPEDSATSVAFSYHPSHSDLLSFLKGCVHIKNKSVSKIFHSFTMCTYPSLKLRQAENIHFFHFSKMEMNFSHESSLPPCVRDLICMFEIFCFSLSAPGDFVSILGAHLV